MPILRPAAWVSTKVRVSGLFAFPTLLQPTIVPNLTQGGLCARLLAASVAQQQQVSLGAAARRRELPVARVVRGAWVWLRLTPGGGLHGGLRAGEGLVTVSSVAQVLGCGVSPLVPAWQLCVAQGDRSLLQPLIPVWGPAVCLLR